MSAKPNEFDALLDGKPVPPPADVAGAIRNAAAPQAPKPAMLTEEVAALAASLGVSGSGAPGAAYNPDEFMACIRALHDKLLDAKDALKAQAAGLREREAKVAAREQAVAFREAKASGMAQLAGMLRLDLDDAAPVVQPPAPQPTPVTPPRRSLWRLRA